MDIVGPINGALRKVPAWPLYIVGAAYASWEFYLAATGRIGADPINLLEREYGAMALKLIIAGLQLAAVTHLVGHAADGGNKHCSVCLAAGAAGTAMPASALVLPAITLRARPVFAPAQPAPPGALTARYQARAPPVSV